MRMGGIGSERIQDLFGGCQSDPFTEPDETDLFMLEERIITVASRYAQTARQAPAIVTVYTDAELRGRGCRPLSDALRIWVKVHNE